MLPEGRGERQARVYKMWADGMFGDPLSPQALTTYFDLARFPHMSRATKPGGIDRTTAEQNVGKLLQGAPAMQIPVFEWYDHEIHLFVLERYMKSPEFLKLDPATMQQFVVFRMILLQGMVEAQAAEAERMATVAAAQQVGAQSALMAEADRRGLPPPLEPGPPDRGATNENPGDPRTRSPAA